MKGGNLFLSELVRKIGSNSAEVLVNLSESHDRGYAAATGNELEVPVNNPRTCSAARVTATKN